MPDITMCPGEDCPVRDSCYRFTATPHERQSYYMLEPIVSLEPFECEGYIALGTTVGELEQLCG